MSYTSWDGDHIQGCICDYPYTGYDCSIKQCEYGPDISTTSSNSLTAGQYTYELFTMQCQATSGYFVMLILGEYTQQIPYNSDVSLLKLIIMNAVSRSKSMYRNVGSNIKVVMQGNIDSGGTGNTGSPTVCGDSTTGVLTTTIQFKDYVGPRPPIYINPSLVTNTRMFGTSSMIPLAYSGTGNTPVLRMATIFTLTCAICSACNANTKLYFMMNSNISSSISITNAGAPTIRNTILAISDLNSATSPWTHIVATVVFATGGPGVVCSSAYSATTTITLYSDYGNIPGFQVRDDTGGYLTVTSSYGTGTLTECSSNGVCNRKTGK